jgi:hypothetical protein
MVLELFDRYCGEVTSVVVGVEDGESLKPLELLGAPLDVRWDGIFSCQ